MPKSSKTKKPEKETLRDKKIDSTVAHKTWVEEGASSQQGDSSLGAESSPTARMRTRISNRNRARQGIARRAGASSPAESGAIYYDFSSPHDFGRFTSDLTSASPYSIEFILQKNGSLGDFAYIEEELLIAPVSVLQKSHVSKNFLGVFAKKDFKHRGDVCLGEYIGEVKQTKDTKKNRHFDADYAFDLKNGTTIDAKNIRGWPAMVNATSCYESSNVMAKNINGRIYYYLMKDIKAGEQLLIYYGDDYTFKDKRFLNPSDGWEESIDKFRKYQDFYNPRVQLDSSLVTLLGFSTNLFSVPDPALLQQSIFIDAPILGYRNAVDFLPQNQQENMTLLMLACWQGNKPLVQDLLTLGSNPYQQTSIHGYSALHFIVLSSHINLDQKIEMIESIIHVAGSTLKLQDLNDETILHLAIKSHQIGLVQYILRKNASKSRHGLEKSILACINADEQDVFVLAMASPHLEMIDNVLPYMQISDVTDCLEDSTALFKALTPLIKTVTREQFDVRVQRITECLRVPDKEKKQLIKLIKRLMPKLSLDAGRIDNAKSGRVRFFGDQEKSDGAEDNTGKAYKRARHDKT